MIVMKDVWMRYPVPRRYHEYITHPLRRPLRTALRGVSLEIAGGQCTGFIGGNGVGKTTLLRLVGGLLYPTCGQVTVAGYDTRRHSQQIRHRVGYVMNEERSFYWRLTGRQNLEFFAALDDVFGREARRRIDELARLVGLSEAMDTRVAFYSSGMRQRLALARAMIADTEVLILDEPTRSVDPVAAEQLRELILTHMLSDGNRTVLLASNQLCEIEAMCDSVYVLSRGQIAFAGSIEEAKAGAGGLAALCKAALGDPKYASDPA
jgi:ABC-2 type transport system ATP-binding protein